MTRIDHARTRLHPAATMYAGECRSGHLSRREFLTRATALGVAAPGAYGLIGLGSPARAQATPRRGGTLRVQMKTRPLSDPRLWDWPEMANFARGWLEYLVEYEADGTIEGALLESWEVSDNATTYILHVRPDVRWNNGEPFTAADVVHNIERWCDGTLENNSMATRVTTLMDDSGLGPRVGAIEQVDDLTVRLTLSSPDITLIAGFSDYPAAIVHPSLAEEDPSENPIGTGPYLPQVNLPGDRQVLVRNEDHVWWGDGAYLDQIDLIDLGTDPSNWVQAAIDDQIDMTNESAGDYLDVLNSLGWTRSEALTANTVCIRFNQAEAPFEDVRVRSAIQLAVDNAVVLELGNHEQGLIGENHHVCPIHPDYAELPPLQPDPSAARALMEEAGHLDTEVELVSLDDDWQSLSCDVVAAQMQDAGLKVTRRILPSSVVSRNWKEYAFSATAWNMRPLGIQVLSLAYRSGAPWNETGFANAAFDAALDRAMAIDDADKRRDIMAELETILQQESVMIQPFWRTAIRHAKPSLVNTDIHPMLELRPARYGFEV